MAAALPSVSFWSCDICKSPQWLTKDDSIAFHCFCPVCCSVSAIILDLETLTTDPYCSIPVSVVYVRDFLHSLPGPEGQCSAANLVTSLPISASGLSGCSLASTVILDSGEKENSPQPQSSPIRGRGRQQRCSLNGPLRRSSAQNRSQQLADAPAAQLDKAGLHVEGIPANVGTNTAGPAHSAGMAGRAADRAAAAYARPPELVGTSPADTASSSRRALSAGRSPEVGQWAAEQAGQRQVEALRNAHVQALRELQARWVSQNPEGCPCAGAEGAAGKVDSWDAAG